MPLPRRRRVAVALVAALVVDAGLALLSGAAGAAAPASAPESAATQEETEAVATLEIIDPGASVRRAGKESFKPAKDGQKLKVGDTIQTDATGFAQVNYTDDGQSFTRLDVNTTFTIESITDDEGNRQIKGNLESGQTWNRVEALTENESFEQEGAGATAATTGTAFLVSCAPVADIDPSDPAATPLQTCTFTSVVHGITVTTVDGEVQELDPLEACGATEIDATDADLCAAVEQVTLDAILANQFLIENLFIDGKAGLEGIVVVEGTSVTFTPTESTPPAEVTPPPEQTEEPGQPPQDPLPTPPEIDANPVNVTDYGSDNPDGHVEGETTRVISQDERNDVLFVLQVSGDSVLVFVFTDLPGATFGTLFDHGTGLAVALGNEYEDGTVFRFDPVEMEAICSVGSPTAFSQCYTNGDPTPGGSSQAYSTLFGGPTDNGDGTVSWYDSFSFQAKDAGGEVSATQTVILEAVDDHCNEGSRTADAVVSNCPSVSLGTSATVPPADVPAEPAEIPAPAPELDPAPSTTVEEPTPIAWAPA